MRKGDLAEGILGEREINFNFQFPLTECELKAVATKHAKSTQPRKGSKLLKGAQFRLNPSLFRKASYVERSKK